MKTAFVYTDRYFEYDYGWSHPLKIERLTTNGFCEVVSFMVKLAPSWVALGGGGYSITNVARAWSLAWAIMNNVNLPHQLPAAHEGSGGVSGKKCFADSWDV